MSRSIPSPLFSLCQALLLILVVGMIYSTGIYWFRLSPSGTAGPETIAATFTENTLALREALYPTPLDVERILSLIKRGADIEVRDQSGETCLIRAVSHQNEVIVEALLAHGANVNASSYGGFTPLYYAVFTGNIGLTKRLLDAGADINQPDSNGETPLICASQQGWVNVVRVLVERGAEVRSKDREGNTALSWATRNRDIEVYAQIKQILNQKLRLLKTRVK